jgi:hypothetical protein
MSFDLKILNGDLVIGTNSDFGTVENTEKLIQDILKMLMTEIGSNQNFPWYGSSITSSMLGSPYDIEFIATIAENQIRSSLETLQSLQREQSLKQIVTPSELLAAIKNINVIRNEVDPTFFSVLLSVLTKNLNVADASFDVTL